MKEESIIARYGKKTPFKPDEAYFKGLTSNIMAKIPENEVVMITPKRRKGYRVAIAAVCCSLLALGTLVEMYFSTSAKPKEELANQKEEMPQEESSYIEDMVDYALMSDAMIYYEYLSDEQ